jgi:anti-anti-sigma factor
MLNVDYRKEKDNISILDLSGAFDLDSQDLVRQLVSTNSDNSAGNQLWNFSHVDAITSSGIGILLNAIAEIKEQGRIAKLVSVAPELLDVFAVHKVLPALDIRPDEASALKQIRMEMSEKEKDYIRLFERVKVVLKARFRQFGNTHGSDSLSGAETRCLSRSGLFLSTDLTYDADTLLDVRLLLPVGLFKPQVRFLGKVVWVADKAKQPDMYPGMALCTLFMDGKERTKLEEFLSCCGG